jgi:hypothetical protein
MTKKSLLDDFYNFKNTKKQWDNVTTLAVLVFYGAPLVSYLDVPELELNTGKLPIEVLVSRKEN